MSNQVFANVRCVYSALKLTDELHVRHHCTIDISVNDLFTRVFLMEQNMMDKTSHSNFGIYGTGSITVGIISCFVPGFSALFVGLMAVFLGFRGSRKHQKMSQAGLLIGGVVVLFVNIVNIGIIPTHRFIHSDKYHLINSINGSIRAFDAMKDAKVNDSSRNELLKHLRYSLNEAKLVDITSVDRQVEGFSAHYRDEFIIGTEALIHGYENNDVSEKLHGGVLLDKWARWNQEKRSDLGEIREPELSFFSFIYKIIIP